MLTDQQIREVVAKIHNEKMNVRDVVIEHNSVFEHSSHVGNGYFYGIRARLNKELQHGEIKIVNI